jgi:plastocyanin
MQLSAVRISAKVALGAALVMTLVACSSSASEGQPDASPPPDADLTVVAENMSFDTSEIVLEAGKETLLYFVNRDGDQHNLAIYPDADGGEPLFRGELIGEGSTEYRIPALEPGTYHFQCDPHAPIMNGTVVVEGDGS